MDLNQTEWKYQRECPTIKHLNVIMELLDKIDEVIIDYEKLNSVENDFG